MYSKYLYMYNYEIFREQNTKITYTSSTGAFRFAMLRSQLVAIGA